jgi:selenocysteine-specific elongation factor
VKPQLARDYLRRNGFVPFAEFRAMGLDVTGERLGEWLADPGHLADLRGELPERVADWTRDHPVAAGMPAETLRQRLGLPALDLVAPLLAGTGLDVADGLVRRPGAGLAPAVERAVRVVEGRLADSPFRAPEADDLRALGLGRKELAAAVRLGRLTAIADGVLLGPDAEQHAVAALRGVAQPFTVSEARRALDSTRRVMIPLLERLDAAGTTIPLGDGRRRLSG